MATNPFSDPEYGGSLQPFKGELDKPAPATNPFSDPNYGNAPPGGALPEPGLLRTIARTGGQMLTTGATSLEDVTGPNSLTKAARETGQGIIDRNPAGINKLSDVVDKPWLAVKEAVGQFAPQIGAAAAGGFTGARAGGALGSLLGPGGAAVGAAVGGVAGGLLPIFTQEYGGIRQEQIASGQEDKGRALAAAGAATALERVGMGQALKTLRGVVPAGGAASIAKGLGKGALREGATEGAQNVVEQWGAFKDPTTGENLEDTALAAVMGSIGGGVMGGAGGAVDAARQRVRGADVAPEAAPDAEPAAPEAPLLLLGNTPPDRLVSFPDGTVGRTGEVESYLAGLPESQRAEARARLMGQSFTEVNDPQAQQDRRWWENYTATQPMQQSQDHLAELQASVRSGTPFSTQQTVDAVRTAMEDAWLAHNVGTDPAEGASIGEDSARAADAAGAQMQDEFERSGDVAALIAVDARMRSRRVLSGLQNILDSGADNTAQVLGRLNEGLARVNEAPLAADEVARVRRITDAFMGFKGVREKAPLPSLHTPIADPFANNSSMESLIPERRPSQIMGIDPAAGPISRNAALAVDSAASAQMAQAAQAEQAALMPAPQSPQCRPQWHSSRSSPSRASPELAQERHPGRTCGARLGYRSDRPATGADRCGH